MDGRYDMAEEPLAALVDEEDIYSSADVPAILSQPYDYYVLLFLATPQELAGDGYSFPYAILEDSILSLLDDDVVQTSGVYLANDIFFSGPTDDPSNVIFHPRMIQPFRYASWIPIPGSLESRGHVDSGGIVIENGDGEMDDILEKNWIGQTVEIKVGLKNAVFSTFETLFSGLAKNLSWDDAAITINIQDKSLLLERLVQTDFYAGTGGLEGTAELEGKPKPRALGPLFNVAPPIVDPTSLILQLNDGQIEEVTAVRDKGVALVFDADVADITTATPGANEYSTSLATGYIKLGTSPNGTITVNFKGDKLGGTYVETGTDIIRRLVTDYGPLAASDIDEDSFTLVESNRAYPVGVWTGTEPVTFETLVSQIMASLDGWHIFSYQSKLRVGIYTDPDSQPTQGEITDVDYKDGSLTRHETREVMWRLGVAYQKNWMPQQGDALAAAVSAADKLLYSQENQYKYSSSSVLKDVRPEARDERLDSFLATDTDANELSADMFRRYRGARHVYSLTLLNKLFNFEVGNVITLTSSKFGLDAGKAFYIFGVDRDIESREVILSLWG